MRDAHPDPPNSRAPDVQCHNGWLVRPAVALCTPAMGGLMSLTSEVAGATTRSAVSGARRENGATQDAALESQLKDDSNGSRYGS